MNTITVADIRIRTHDVWQIDASICTLFYVPEGGVEAMSNKVFYKNKPDNFAITKPVATQWGRPADAASAQLNLNWGVA